MDDKHEHDGGMEGAFNLRSNQIRTRHLFAGAVTNGKLGYKSVAVNVALGAGNGSSAADPDLVGGVAIGIVPAGNQDQLVDNVVVNGDGSVTVTLAANAVAINNFKIAVMKADAKGVS